MTNTIFHDKSMLSLVLIVAFFVGASATNAFMDDAFAGNHGNNGNNGCENANPNAKACENNPNTDPVKTIKITTIFNESPIPDAECLLVDISGTVVAGGVTDVNAELLVTVPDTVNELSIILCSFFIAENNQLFGAQCPVPLTDPFTEVIVIIPSDFGNCF